MYKKITFKIEIGCKLELLTLKPMTLLGGNEKNINEGKNG